MSRSRQPRVPRQVGFTRQPRIADQMTPHLDRLVASSCDAERAGDAQAALEFHQAVPMFRHSAHREQLTQLAGLAEEMTPWLWARWAAYQCTRAEGRHVSGEIVRSALHYTTEMFYPDRLQVAYDEGDDPVRVVASLMGEAWLFHQLCTFELGGLAEFLDHLATGRLAEHSGWARSWCDARMGAYRLESSAPEPLVVTDLRDDRRLELLDLGAAVHADEGGWLLGRLVPSGTGPRLMFDSRPVAIDEQTAREVAAGRGRGAWIAALKSGLDDGRVERDRFESEDRDLATDVPSWTLVEAGTPPSALAHERSRLDAGSAGVGRAAFRMLRAASEDRLPDAMAAFVAAAVVNAHGHSEAWRLLATSTPAERWTHWAPLVPEPARSRLLRLGPSRTAA